MLRYNQALNLVKIKMNAQFGIMNNLTESVSLIGRVTRSLTASLRKLDNKLGDLQHFTTMQATFSSYYFSLSSFVSRVMRLVDDLVLASHGTVLPSLIPSDALTAVLIRIKINSEFSPLFPMIDLILVLSICKIFCEFSTI